MAKAFHYRRPTLGQMLANLNRHDFDADLLEELLCGIRGMIRKSTKRVSKLDDSDADGDNLAEFAMQENMLIDALLGCAFVLCQTNVTAIAIGVVFAEKRGLQINGADKRKAAIKLGSAPSQKIVSDIELAANYFKHNEEWSIEGQGSGKNHKRVWVKTNSSKDTIALAEKSGLTPGNCNNIKALAALLGIQEGDDYEGLPALANQLKVWHGEMIEIVRAAPKKP